MNNEIKDYLQSARQVGHTKVLTESLRGVDEPFFILGADMSHAKDLAKRIGNPHAIPVSLSVSSTMRGRRLPLVMDNHAFSTVCENYENKIKEIDFQHRKELALVDAEKQEIVDYNKFIVKILSSTKGKVWFAEGERDNLREKLLEQKEKTRHYKEQVIINEKEFLDSLSLFQRIFKKTNKDEQE
jgi:hypothetical protein